MQRLENPIPVWPDVFGAPLDAGFVYVGLPNQDPQTSSISCYLDQALTVPIAQPLRTLGGKIVSGENAVNVYFAQTDASITVRDSSDQLVLYVPTIALSAVAYQPANSTLDLLAALATTSFGRALLTLANQPALQAAVGLPAALPLIGGTVTGAIVRGGAGVHFFYADAAMTGGKVYVTDAGSSDLTSAPGDIQFMTAPA